MPESVTMNRVLLAVAVWVGLVPFAHATEGVNFSRDVQPILAENCYFCHGPDAKKRKADLRLDTREGAYRTDSGDPVIKPGDSAASELIRRITSTNPKEQMPPPKSNRKLTPEQVALLKRWIDAGAPWGEHWAFAKLERPALPPLTPNPSPPRGEGSRVPPSPLGGEGLGVRGFSHPIDLLVQARLAKEGLTLAPQAPRETLLRRVTLDLTGLPPTPEEVDSFLKDTASDAYEKVVDRLLASPAYGERMAWDWLDAARYADSNGYQGDGDRTMWPWRDWVVDAFNRNLPYDQFTVWQLAGDLLPQATFEQKLATGFCRNHMINGEGGRIAEENRVEYVMDMAETAGTVWLGLTLNCCRCHDHKFDPLSQRDYYGMFAFFNQTPVTGGGGDPQSAPNLEVLSDEDKAKLAVLQAAVAERQKVVEALEARLVAGRKPAAERTAKQLEELEQAATAYAKALADLRRAVQERDAFRRGRAQVMVMEDMPQPRKTFLLTRGLYNKPGAEVTAAVPAKLPALPTGVPANRLGLARWLVAPENPLTARVTVNRLWQQFFGVGWVKTTEDFGVQAEIPRHGELLDWLAAEFRDGGWDMKALMRLIVTSQTYRQSSKVTPGLAARDPDNRLLARGPRYRLPSWMLRDQALAASGLLVGRRGGPPVNGYQPPGVWEEATFGNKKYKQDHGEALYRRSLYTFWRRIIAPTMFFDSASRQVCTVKPFRTNTPLHALATLNDVTYVEAARALAERALLHGGSTTAARFDFAFRRVLSRLPTPQERTVLTAGLERARAEFARDPADAKRFLAVGESPRDERLDAVEHAAWAAVCSAILNLDEALTKE